MNVQRKLKNYDCLYFGVEFCDENDILMTRTGNTGQVVTDVKGAFHNNFGSRLAE